MGVRMKYLVVGISALLLFGNLSVAEAADDPNLQPAIMVIASTGNTPNSGGGITTVAFQTLTGCTNAIPKVTAAASSGNVTIGAACLPNPPVGK
jgi:hypothetical protein